MFQSVLNPPVLFFFLGMTAALVRSDLELPQPVARLLSFYLLLAIGYRGGAELAHSGFSTGVAQYLLVAAGLALAVPVYVFWLLKKRLGVFDAAGVAASYGSVSAVTFITAVAHLDRLGIAYGGHTVAALAVMESPAIIAGVLCGRLFAPTTGERSRIAWGALFHDALLNGSVVVLLGSFFIGLVSGRVHGKTLEPFITLNFSGLLAFFLLDMGLEVGRRVGDLRRVGVIAVVAGVMIPLVNALFTICVCRLLAISMGDALLLTVLAASASYIAVPAALRMALPEANSGVYLPMALAVTFPFNVMAGIPLYHAMLKYALGA